MEVSGDTDIVKMSSKGQLVVPQDIREMANLMPGERFIAVAVDEGVLFKKIGRPQIKIDFNSLAKEVEENFKKNNVTETDIKEAVKWARKE